MVSKKVRVIDETGLHLRPAGILCKEACKYKCTVSFQTERGVSNAKSVLSVLGACVRNGDEVLFICDGEDEEIALKNITKAVEKGLGNNFKIVD